MKQSKLIFITTLIVLLITSNLYPQTASSENQHFERAFLCFDYPTDWILTDSSTEAAQHITVGPRGSVTQISVVVESGAVSSCDIQGESQKIKERFLEETARQIKADIVRNSLATTSIGKTEVSGIELHGRLSGKQVTADVYSIRLNRHFLSLAYLRVDDDDRANAVWATVRQTLDLQPAVIAIAPASTSAETKPGITSGVLNGKALALPQPAYPVIARQAHAGGTVTVQVTIDESGDVISAHAISGHPLLQAASVAAARASKFSPTKLCDEPVRVTGVIQYQFVAR